jgi:HAD superfamily hydrolase (TIGR01490 family)
MKHGARPFAAFDIDGTLIRWQLYHAVVDKLAKEGALGTDAHAKLHEARMVWKRREHPEAFKVYERRIIEVYESALSNLATKTFDRMVLQVIDEYKDQTYAYTRQLVDSLKKDGYMLLMISGSHYELVEQIAKYYKFDDFSGTRYERKDGAFSGEKFIASQDKRKGLEEMVASHNLTSEGSLAIGDSASDAPMLELVEQPIAFNPDRALFEIARQKGWKIVIERKNMIYELEKHSDKYILAETNA